MTRSYIPDSDLGKLRWIRIFNTWFQTHGAAYGFSPAQIADLTSQTAAYIAAMTEHKTVQATARAATQKKNTARRSVISLARSLAQQLQSNAALTNSDRGAAGLTIPDTTQTAADPIALMMITPPMLVLDFSIRQQVTIHWGPNPNNERRNGRPEGIQGCQVEVARDGSDTEAKEWIPLEPSTKSPVIHLVEENTPTSFIYRAYYVGNNLKHGPIGDSARCTVSV
ncbi:MAG: hypothetical protein KAH38_11040 [Candidatus Hydrogenedentes bacterium]|nr:hypothetical protein [Candidatus Hydrogenedentota bacterium]